MTKLADPPPAPAAGSAETSPSRRAPMPWKLLALITAGIIVLGLAISNTQKTTPGRVTLETTSSLGQATPEKKAKTEDLQSQPKSQPAAGGVPAWLELRKGARAYTGDDGGSESTLTVCPSVYLYKKWFSSATAVVPECSEKLRGIPVTVNSDQIFSSGLEGEFFVFIKADDFSWSGWTGSVGLQPRIPTNTKVVVTGGENEKWFWFFPNKTSAAGRIELGGGAALQILAQDPKSGDRPDLYAQIIGNSAYAGKKGAWNTFDRRMQSEIFPYCAAQQIGVMAYGSLAYGMLSGVFHAGMQFDESDWRSKGGMLGSLNLFRTLFGPELT
jgi:hypothetical protein